MLRDSWPRENGLHGEFCVYFCLGWYFYLIEFFLSLLILIFIFWFFFFKEREIKRKTEKKSMKMGG